MGSSATLFRAEIWVESSRLQHLFEPQNHDGVAGFCENAGFYAGLDFELDDDDNICGVTYECDPARSSSLLVTTATRSATTSTESAASSWSPRSSASRGGTGSAGFSSSW